MGIGISIFLLAVGAILAFGVHVVSSGIDVSAVGVILMIIGAVGLLVALAISGAGAGWGPRAYRRTTYVDNTMPAAGTPVVPVAPVAPVARRTVVRDTYVD